MWDVRGHQGNANPNHCEVPPTPVKWLELKRQTTPSAGEEQGAGFVFTVGESVKWYSLAVFSKVKHEGRLGGSIG